MHQPVHQPQVRPALRRSSSGPGFPGIEEAIDLWNQTYSNIYVEFTRTTGGTEHYNKLKAAVAAGPGGPDLAQLEFQLLTSLVVAGTFDPITQVAAPIKDKFVDWTWQQVTLVGDVYAIPQDIGPMGMYYRKDIFDQYGIAVPTTWDEYAAAAEELHTADPSKYITTFPPGNPSWFLAHAWQNGATWFGTGSDAWQVNINGPETQQVADYWQDLINRNLVKVGADFNPAWFQDLNDGNVVTWLSAAWGTTILATNAAESAGQWAVAYLPQWSAGAKAASNWGGSTSAVVKGSQHIPEAVEFATWLNTDPGSLELLIQNGGLFPASKDGQTLPIMTQSHPYFDGQVVNDVFRDAAATVDPSWIWGPTMDQVYATLGDNFTAAVNEGGTLSAALDTVQARTVADIQGRGMSVA